MHLPPLHQLPVIQLAWFSLLLHQLPVIQLAWLNLLLLQLLVISSRVISTQAVLGAVQQLHLLILTVEEDPHLEVLQLLEDMLIFTQISKGTNE
jgi:hypothetical protein